MLAPVYRGVRVAVPVSGGRPTPDARDRVVDALRRHLDPLRGGTAAAGLAVRRPGAPVGLIGVAAAAAGPEVTVTALAVALDDGPPVDCADLPIGPRDLVAGGREAIARTVAVPSGGGLR